MERRLLVHRSMPRPDIDREAARARLLARRRAILARYQSQLALAEEVLTPEIELNENATEQWDARVLSTLADADLRAIDQIAVALARLDAGSYGLCAICRAAIGDERLRVLPEAVICVDCAGAREAFASG
jgi:RNA polymerase-binding transcription factor DksA